MILPSHSREYLTIFGNTFGCRNWEVLLGQWQLGRTLLKHPLIYWKAKVEATVSKLWKIEFSQNIREDFSKLIFLVKVLSSTNSTCIVLSIEREVTNFLTTCIARTVTEEKGCLWFRKPKQNKMAVWAEYKQ